jgi:hypothetical protein
MLISFSGAVHNVSSKYRIGVGKTRQDSSLSITDPSAQDADCVSQRFPPQDSDGSVRNAILERNPPGNIRSHDWSSQNSPAAAGAAAIQDLALGMSGTDRELRRSEGEGHPSPEPLSNPARVRTTGAVRQLFAVAGVARLPSPICPVRPRAPSTAQSHIACGCAFFPGSDHSDALGALPRARGEAGRHCDGPSVLVEAANGQPLGRVGPLSDAVKRGDFPDTLVKAVLSIEDRRFYSHWGIDPWSIARAMHANWTAG